MKSLLLILLALTITTLNLKAEPLSGQAKIDSLLAELPKAKGDTNEVNLLQRISFSYYTSNPDKGIEYGLKGLKLAKKLGWKKGEGSSYNSIASNYMNMGELSKAIDYFQNSVKIFNRIGDKKSVASIYQNIGTIYLKQPDYPRALEYFQKSLRVNKELNENEGVAENLSKIGALYISQSKYSEALENYLKALEISKKIDDKNGIASNFGSIAIIYARQSNYPEALKYFQKSLKINEEVGNIMGKASALGNIGNIYNSLSNFPKALKYFNEALEIFKEIGNKIAVGAFLGNIGLVYSSQSNYPKATEYYHEALKIMVELGDKKGIGINYTNLGKLYTNQKNYPKALEYYHNSLKIMEETGDKYGLAVNLLNTGALYYNLSQDTVLSKIKNESQYLVLDKEINLNKSIDHYLKSLELSKEINALDIMSSLNSNLYKAYKKRGEFEKALLYFEEYKELQDSIYSQKNSDKIAAFEKAREDDLNRKEIEKQKAINAEKERINQIITYITIAGFIVLIIVLIIIYRLLKRSDKLLYNVLPVSIAKRLKKKEHPISDYFTQASIVFIDIVNFTELSKDEDPRRVVEALNKIFTKYDTISNKYGLEKIKTIGDSYMAAAGIPEVQKDNTHRAAQMALEVKAMMHDYHTADGTKIEVRIGLDCGPVVAGVIGENKFIYDMWSDAVNTASRMESSSIAGEVHVSERFKDAVTEYEEFSYVERGEIEIKGKGKMKTFFMGSKKLEV